ncbi:hypothetical protein HZY86_01945 [Aerococcaceae bacterium DSM 111020]|nr:hypothetical protein [Aerococcaceae bacterium DSM 111020]
MNKIDNTMRVRFQYTDPFTEKTITHNFNDIATNASAEDLRLVKDAVDAVSAQTTDTVIVTENYQVIL